VPLQLLKLQSKRLHAGLIYTIYRASWIILASSVLFEIWSYGAVSVGESGGQSNWRKLVQRQREGSCYMKADERGGFFVTDWLQQH
jgi:hypothetical protein